MSTWILMRGRGMKRRLAPLLILAAALPCSALEAAASPPRPILSAAPAPDPEVYKPTVVGMFRQRLIDPDSAIYDWSEPYQMTCRKGVYHTPDRWQGWAVDVNVNAKNQLGGFTGPKFYTVIFTDDGVEIRTEVLDGDIFWMFKSCRREAW